MDSSLFATIKVKYLKQMICCLAGMFVVRKEGFASIDNNQ
ncbi:hypothetical protein EVA_10468 [gut metagenome]|uniref:Uncharacterized protein n=1 Tax=gut metagenome TaxID=749906 RepID=J9GHP4_9ZZZZ